MKCVPPEMKFEYNPPHNNQYGHAGNAHESIDQKLRNHNGPGTDWRSLVSFQNFLLTVFGQTKRQSHNAGNRQDHSDISGRKHVYGTVPIIELARGIPVYAAKQQKHHGRKDKGKKRIDICTHRQFQFCESHGEKSSHTDSSCLRPVSFRKTSSNPGFLFDKSSKAIWCSVR